MSDEQSIRDEIERAFNEWWNAPHPDDGSDLDFSEYIMPLVRRAQAEAVREYRVALSENPSADNWDKRDFLDDIENWTQMLAHEAHYIEQEAGA